jgi:hypothetical protein
LQRKPESASRTTSPCRSSTSTRSTIRAAPASSRKNGSSKHLRFRTRSCGRHSSTSSPSGSVPRPHLGRSPSYCAPSAGPLQRGTLPSISCTSRNREHPAVHEIGSDRHPPAVPMRGDRGVLRVFSASGSSAPAGPRRTS